MPWLRHLRAPQATGRRSELTNASDTSRASGAEFIQSILCARQEFMDFDHRSTLSAGRSGVLPAVLEVQASTQPSKRCLGRASTLFCVFRMYCLLAAGSWQLAG